MLKKLLFVGAIVAIIPLEQENQAELYTAAKSTVADISSFCSRNPNVCLKGNAALDRLATKAEFGARMMVDIAKEQSHTRGDGMAQLLQRTHLLSSSDKAKPQPAQSEERFPGYRNNQYNEHYAITSNTLSPSDLQPGWRGGSK